MDIHDAQRRAESRRQLAHEVAALLGGALIERDNDADRWSESLRIEVEGRAIALDFTAQREGDRITASGIWPLEKKPDGATCYHSPYSLGVIGHTDSAPKIRCSASRGSAAVAREIERRFMPAFRTIYDKCVAAIKAREVASTSAMSHARGLADRIGIKPENVKPHDGGAHFYVSEWGGVNVWEYNGALRVDFERRLTGLTPTEALAILKILQRERYPEPA